MRLFEKIKRIWKSAGEDNFYKKMFIQNPSWNKPIPNKEEQLRWEIIEKFMLYITSQKAAKETNSRLRVLDLGCGRGWLSNLLTQYGKVTGIEPVKAVVEYGKKLFKGLDLQTGTAEDLIANGYSAIFNVLVCSEVIEHITDEKKAAFAAAIKKLLKPNGYLIITTPRKEMQAEWLQYSRTGQPVEEWMEEVQVQLLFEKHDFKKIFLERFAIPPAAAAPAITIYQLWLFQQYAK